MPLIEVEAFTRGIRILLGNVFFFLQNLSGSENAAPMRLALRLITRGIATSLHRTGLHEINILQADSLPGPIWCSKTVCGGTRGEAVLLQAVLVVRQP